MIKKTNKPAKHAGGVNKDKNLRVKVIPKSSSRSLAVIDVTPIKKKKRITEEDVPVKKKKKRLINDDQVQVKKKKKKIVRDLDTVLRKRISKADGDDNSIIGDAAEEILQLLEDNNSQSAVPLIYKRLLQSLVDTIPAAEHAVRASKGAKGVYQLNSLISSLRELMVDIQSSQDRGQLGASIVESILRPAYKDLAISVLTEYESLISDMRLALENLGSSKVTEEKIDTEKRLMQKNFKESRERLANSMQTQYNDSATKIVDYLQR